MGSTALEIPGTSFDDVSNGDFATWSVGIELRLPLDGGIRAKKQLQAVTLEVQQAELTLESMETEVSTGISAALHNMKSTYSSVGNHDKVVEFYTNLLNTQLERLEVGTVDNQQVLETEEDLLEAKIQSLMAKILFAKLFFNTIRCVAQSSGNAILNSPRIYSRSKHNLW